MFKVPSHRCFLLSAFALGCIALLTQPITKGWASDAPPELPAASSHALFVQRVGITEVEVDYSRPNKNGRDIFGKLVPFDVVWRTGANKCTKVTFSDDVNLGGKSIPAGKYGLFTIPNADQWTIILSKNADQWGAFDYNPADDLVRFTAKPETLAAPMETFTIGLADVHEDSARFCLEWDRTRVSIPLTVDTVAKVKAEIGRVLSAPGASAEFYAQAADYYRSHNLDLAKALEWIDQSIQMSPKNYTGYALKASIQAQSGDKPGALATVEQAIKLAKADPEQTDGEAVAHLTKLSKNYAAMCQMPQAPKAPSATR